MEFMLRIFKTCTTSCYQFSLSFMVFQKEKQIQSVSESKRSPKESSEKTIQPPSAIASEQKPLVEDHYKEEFAEEEICEKHSPYEHPASTDYAEENDECVDNDDQQGYYKDEEVRIHGHEHDYAPERREHEGYEREDDEKEQSLQMYDDENDEQENVEYNEPHASEDFGARGDEEDENEEEAYGKPYKDYDDEDNGEDGAGHHVSDQTKAAAEKSDEEDDD